ncbi:MAG: TolC family protein [Bacteroidales bacterium]|nr:TolC family protein [Bacteroidales bacterium]
MKQLKFLFLIIIIGGTLLIKQTFAQESLKFTLNEARNYALLNNYDIKNAIIDKEIAQKKIWETTAIGLPQIESKLEYSDYLKIPTQLIPGEFFDKPGEFIEVQFGTKHNITASITATQLIFNGSYIVGLQTAKTFLSLSDQELQKTQINIKETITETYYNILVAEDSKEILSSTIDNLQKTKYEVSEMYKEGFVEETDVDQINLSLTNLKNSLNSINRQIEIAYNLLKYQMGIDLSVKIKLTQNLDEILEEINFDAIIDQQFVLANNLDFKLLTTQESLMHLNLKNEKTKFLPSLSAFYSHSRNAQREEFNFTKSGELWFPTTLIGLNLNLPIFSSGMKRAKVNQAKLDLEKVRNSKLQAEQGLELEVSRARATLISSLENYRNAIDNVNLSKKIYDKTIIKYSEGVATSTELTQERNQYLSNESDYINTLSILLNAKNKLDKALNNYN